MVDLIRRPGRAGPAGKDGTAIGGFVATLAFVTACGTAGQGSTTTPPLGGPPDTIAPVSGAILDWNDSDATVVLRSGWTVHACLGDAPLMCFDHDGSEVAAMEAHLYPIESFDALDADAGDTANLQAFATAFLTEFTADRAAGCGGDYRLDVIEPRATQLGGQPGIAYGFVGTLPSGVPSEVQLQYATIQGDQVLLINAQAYDDTGCLPPFEAGSFTSAQLLEIRDDLESLLTDIPLPQLPIPPSTP